MVSLVAAGVGLFGALIGSFLNVVVYRVPLKMSVVSPPSACTHCGTRIRGFDNVPIVSWLLLGGECRSCKRGISARYPLVELGTAAFFALVAWWFFSGAGSFGRSEPVVAAASHERPTDAATIVAMIAYLYLAAVSVVLALIDIDTRTLPNRIVLPSYLVGIALLGVAAVVGGDYEALARAGIGSGILWVAYLAMALAYPGGMGFGDVKLAGVLGLYLGWAGWGALVVGAFAAFLLGGLFALVLLASRRVGRKSGIPFGPWMLAGAWAGILGGNTVASGYLSFVGLV